MRRRAFRFLDAQKAANYAAFLSSQEIKYDITIVDGQIDVITPFELTAAQFPNPKDLIGRTSGSRFSDDPDNHCGKWARR